MPDHLTTTDSMPNALPLRPDDLLAFRLGRLILLLDTVPGLPSPKPMDVERISLYDFFADNPFLVFGRDTAEHETLVLAGFDSRNLSYQSSAQRFSSRRERLQHDLATLIAYGLASATTEARRVVSPSQILDADARLLLGRSMPRRTDRALHS